MALGAISHLSGQELSDMMREALDAYPPFQPLKFILIGPLYDVVDYNATTDRFDYAAPTDLIWRRSPSPSDCVWMVPGTERNYFSWMW